MFFVTPVITKPVEVAIHGVHHLDYNVYARRMGEVDANVRLSLTVVFSLVYQLHSCRSSEASQRFLMMQLPANCLVFVSQSNVRVSSDLMFLL